MSSIGGAFFGAVIGAIIGTLIVITLDLISVLMSITAKFAIVGTCMVVGAALLAIHEYKKQAKARA
jgi:predicted ABC-type sugar transport system permease subunit